MPHRMKILNLTAAVITNKTLQRVEAVMYLVLKGSDQK